MNKHHEWNNIYIYYIENGNSTINSTCGKGLWMRTQHLSFTYHIPEEQQYDHHPGDAIVHQEKKNGIPKNASLRITTSFFEDR